MNSRDPLEDVIESFFGRASLFRPFNGFYIDEDIREINPFELFSRDPSFSRQLPGTQQPVLDDLGRLHLTDENPDTREGSGSVFDKVRDRILEIFQNNRVDTHSSPQWDIRHLPESNPGSFRPYLPNDDHGNEVEAPPRARAFFQSYSSRTTVGANGVRETVTTITDQDGNKRTTRTVDGDPQAQHDLYDRGSDVFDHQRPGGFPDQDWEGIFEKMLGGLFGRNDQPSLDWFSRDNQPSYTPQSDYHQPPGGGFSEQGLHGFFGKLFGGLFEGNDERSSYSPPSRQPFRNSEPDIHSLYVNDPGN